MVLREEKVSEEGCFLRDGKVEEKDVLRRRKGLRKRMF